MKIKTLTILFIFILSCLLLCCPSKRDRLQELQETPPKPFTPPQVTIHELRNGLTLYLIEDHTLPTLEVDVFIKTGSIYEDAKKIGLTEIVGDVLRTGGTKKRTGDELEEVLAERAITIETNFGPEVSSISLSAISGQIEFALSILFEIIHYPNFEASKLDLAKKKKLEEIRRRNDSPNKIMFREFKRIVWGAKTPWARISYPETINRISRADLINLHNKYFSPNNMILVAAGDFKIPSFIKIVEGQTKTWAKKDIKFPTVKILSKEEINKQPHLYLVPRDFEQSTIVMGHLGPKRHCPDEYAIAIMNMILGESTFVSRLGKEIRTNLGLAYVVWSFFVENQDLGLFLAGAMTKSASTIQAVQTIRTIIEKMHKDPKITEDEMKSTKETIRNTFIFKYESKFDIARRRALLDYLGYPPDYLDTYLDNIDAVTKEEIEGAGLKYLDPKNLFILVIGNQEELLDGLKGLGLGDPVILEVD